MNFYIGNSIEDFNVKDKNIELSDDLLDFLYKNESVFELKQFVLRDINPYEDIVIDNSELHLWMDMCNSIVSSNILEQYDDIDEARSIGELSVMIQDAMLMKYNIIIIGD